MSIINSVVNHARLAFTGDVEKLTGVVRNNKEAPNLLERGVSSGRSSCLASSTPLSVLSSIISIPLFSCISIIQIMEIK